MSAESVWDYARRGGERATLRAMSERELLAELVIALHRLGDLLERAVRGEGQTTQGGEQ